MTSIFQRALGADFDRLHPQIQARFGVHSAGGVASIGTGVMDEVRRAKWLTRPFLSFGALRRIMFAETGRAIGFTIENWPYVDRFGREAVTFNRTFELPTRRRRFDATMVYSTQRGRVVDYLGTHQHLVADICVQVDADGGLRLRTGEQRFHEGPVGFRFPLWASGVGDVREWFDERAGRHRIEVAVCNRLVGPLFGYRGSFVARQVPLGPHGAPASVKPVREERRE
ncbi:DUF4166 domain-containing protein [soil metagenome]